MSGNSTRTSTLTVTTTKDTPLGTAALTVRGHEREPRARRCRRPHGREGPGQPRDRARPLARDGRPRDGGGVPPRPHPYRQRRRRPGDPVRERSAGGGDGRVLPCSADRQLGDPADRDLADDAVRHLPADRHRHVGGRAGDRRPGPRRRQHPPQAVHPHRRPGRAAVARDEPAPRPAADQSRQPAAVDHQRHRRREHRRHHRLRVRQLPGPAGPGLRVPVRAGGRRVGTAQHPGRRPVTPSRGDAQPPRRAGRLQGTPITLTCTGTARR